MNVKPPTQSAVMAPTHENGAMTATSTAASATCAAARLHIG